MSVVGTEVHTNQGMQTKTAFCIICRGSHHNPPKHLKGGTRWKGDSSLRFQHTNPQGLPAPGHHTVTACPQVRLTWRRCHRPPFQFYRVVYTPRVPSSPSLPRKPAPPPRPQQHPDAAPRPLLALAPPFPRLVEAVLPWRQAWRRPQSCFFPPRCARAWRR